MEDSMNVFPGNPSRKPVETGPETNPKPQNMYEKFLGLHDYKSGAVRVLDFILKKQGPEGLLAEIQKNPLPDFKTYVSSIKEKPDLHTKIAYDLALNSHEMGKIIPEFDGLVGSLNAAKTSEEAETSYKNLIAFFEKYTNSVEDNLN